MTVDVGRVTIATVVDDRPPYVDEVAYLFGSLEVFGGSLRRARRRAYVVNAVSERTEQRLRDLGVDVRMVPEVDGRLRFANKLAMFAAEAEEDTDLLVALDSDLVVAGDFGAYLDTSVVQCRPPDGDPLPLHMWAELFDHFGLALPAERHATTVDPGWTHAYFNTGVLMVPAAFLRPLHDRWLHFVRALVDEAGVLPGLARQLGDKVPHYDGATSDGLEHLFFADQWAFALARHELGLPYGTLPLALNFPMISRPDQRPGEYIRRRFVPHAVTPLLIHHHHDFEQGLRPTGYARPDGVIARVNEALFSAALTAAAAPAADNGP